MKRSSGVLIHPTSFPGKYGCGDLGSGAFKIIDWLSKSGQKWLQILPIGPTGFGDSPYQSFSTFAGNPYFISFENLLKDGLIFPEDLSGYKFDHKKVDYYYLYKNNFKILYSAYLNFKKTKKNSSLFEKFCDEESFWLDDYSLFMSLKEADDGAGWNLWDDEARARQNLNVLKNKFSERTGFYNFIQWIFYSQWKTFREYAHSKGVKIIGDLPIFVSFDSADLWANREMFLLDENGNPKAVAGVPPDYFSVTGQLWGNPLYDWDKMEENGFVWWIKRLKHILKFTDVVRIDHFRGFESFWEIPFGEKTAVNGRWVKAPGKKFFDVLKKEFKEDLNEIIIAEDLGIITDEVKALRDEFGLPGMRIFEFADFPKKKSRTDKRINDAYLPHNYIENCVVYPGTHDNDTLIGWFENLTRERKNDVLDYLKINDKDNLSGTVIKALMDSRSVLAVFLMQDILELPGSARFNTPGTTGEHNWTWRVDENLLSDERCAILYNLTKKSGRAE